MIKEKAWTVEDTGHGTQSLAAMDRFATGECAGLRFRHFLKHEEIQRVLAAISDIGIEYYEGDDKAGRVVRKGKLGPNFFRFKDDHDEYFRRVDIFSTIFENKIIRHVDFFSRVREAISRIFALNNSMAEHHGKRMMNFTVRALPETPIHRDWIPTEKTGLSFSPRITDQFAWNIYLKLPDSGGQTRIFRTQDPALAAVKGSVFTEAMPSVGDLIVFRSTQAHAVMPSSGDRLTLSGFFATTPEKLLFWV